MRLLRKIPLDGRKMPWWKRVDSKVSKFMDGFNQNLLYVGGMDFHILSKERLGIGSRAGETRRRSRGRGALHFLAH